MLAIRKEERKEDGSVTFVTTVTEEKRLSALVQAIDNDGAVAPRGAYHKSPTGLVEVNPCFEGLFVCYRAMLTYQDCLAQMQRN